MKFAKLIDKQVITSTNLRLYEHQKKVKCLRSCAGLRSQVNFFFVINEQMN